MHLKRISVSSVNWGFGDMIVLPGFHNKVGGHAAACASRFSRVTGGSLLAALLLLPAAASTQTVAEPAAQQTAAVEIPATSVGVNLNITPKRLTFDRNTRGATAYIFNQGTTPATFDIAVVDRVMLPSGEIKPASELAADPAMKPLLDRLKSAKNLVVATPRRATLAPGKGQTIRIRAMQPDGSDASGEYRSHLTVTTIPPRNTGLTAEDAANRAPNQLSFRVQSVFGLSIPVIIRPAPVSAQGAIENVSLNYVDLSPDGVAPARRTAVLNFDMARSGTNSLFGNVEIRSSKSQDKEPLGLARGIGVYPEIDRRSVRIPLKRAPQPGEQLDIVFIDDDGKPGNVIARSSFTAS